jgi:fibronectin-binding autotransporter adhesin
MNFPKKQFSLLSSQAMRNIKFLINLLPGVHMKDRFLQVLSAFNATSRLLAMLAVMLMVAPTAKAQINWTGTTSGAWLTATNWAGGIPAGSATTTGNTDIAVFNVNANNTVGINMNTTLGVYYLGAIDNTNSTARIINNSSTTAAGILTLNGATVNGVANTILRNTATTLLTITNGTGSGTLGLALGNSLTNVIQITNTGGITINSVISGIGGITRQGAGTGILTLSGNNNYVGVTAITAGAIAISNSNALGATGSGNNTTIAATGATNGPRLLISGGIDTPENITLTGTTETSNFVAAINNTAGINTLSGNITLSGSSGLKIGASSGTLNLTGSILQSGTSHALVLQPFAATAVINVSNPIAINGGGLLLVGVNGTAGALVNLNGVSGSGIGGTTLAQRITLRLGVSDALNTTARLDLAYAGTTAGEDIATFDLRGFNQTVNALVGTANASNASTNANRIITNGVAGTSILTVGNGGGSGVFNGQINNGVGTIQFIKTGAGTQTLADANSYSGSTTISGGVLRLGNGATGGTTGSLTATSAIINNGNLTINRSNAFTQATELGAGVAISGSGSFTQAGAGATSLTAANSFTGVTNITGGALFFLHPTALGGDMPGVNGTSQINMAAGTSLRSNYIIPDAGIVDSFVYAPINVTSAGTVNLQIGAGSSAIPAESVRFNINGVISGVAGTNVLFAAVNNLNNADSIILLNAASTYDGTTTLTTNNTANRINVVAGVANALPATTVLTFDADAGTGTGRTNQYDLNGNHQTLAGLTNGGLVPNLRRQFVTNSSLTPAILTINSASNFTFGGSTLSGANITRAQITGNLALVKNGAGTMTLGGTLTGAVSAGGNTYTGSTTILAGILELGESISIQNSALDTLNSVVGDPSNGLRILTTTQTFGGLIGNKNLADVFTTTSGGYIDLTALTLNTVAGISPSYSAVIADGAAGMTLTKTGLGTQILVGGNTYTGATAVNAGELRINGSTASPSVTVASGATLSGIGTLTGTVIVNAGGTIRGGSGTTIGTLHIANNSTLESGTVGAILQASISHIGVNSASSSLVNLASGILDLNNSGVGIFTIDLRNDGNTPLVVGENYTINLAQVATAGNITLNTVTQPASTIIPQSNYAVNYDLGTLDPGYILAIDTTGTILQLTFSPTAVVPEPGMLFVVSAGLCGLVRFQRRWHSAK